MASADRVHLRLLRLGGVRSLDIRVEPGTIARGYGRWRPVVHRSREIVVTRFRVLPFTRALTLVGDHGRVLFVPDRWGQSASVVAAVQAAGFSISPTEDTRLMPPLWLRSGSRLTSPTRQPRLL